MPEVNLSATRLCHGTGEEGAENQCELKASLVCVVRLASKEQTTNKTRMFCWFPWSQPTLPHYFSIEDNKRNEWKRNMYVTHSCDYGFWITSKITTRWQLWVAGVHQQTLLCNDCFGLGWVGVGDTGTGKNMLSSKCMSLWKTNENTLATTNMPTVVKVKRG